MRENIKMLQPAEALKRIESAATIVAVGPTTSGKSTLIYALVNYRIVVFINKGIGDKSQTTIIPCTFLFDERIQPEHFSLKVKTRKFASKEVHIEVMEQLAILYANNDACIEDTLDSIDEEWLDRILEPESASYHLGSMKAQISVVEFREVLMGILKALESADKSFEEQVREKKMMLQKQKVKITEVRRIVFTEMWDEISSEITADYFKWLESIGQSIVSNLDTLMGTDTEQSRIYEYSTEKNDKYPYGGQILQKLFDPYMPYSLIIEEMTLACCPREEIIDENAEMPLRFCLRDTMGLNQKDMDSNTIKDALDIALNCSPDSILLLINLEERDDVIAESCEAIAKKMKRAEKMAVPVNVFFTKADKILDNIIYKNNRQTVDIKQEDYDENIGEAIEKMKKAIDGYLTKLPQNNATWLSLRFKDEKIDPIQMALRNINSNEIIRFTPKGLYQNIDGIIKDAQSRILPKGMKSPLFVQVNDYDKPAVTISLNDKAISDVMNKIAKKLTEDKATVNRYLITTKFRIHGRSVVNYYRNLQNGQGYQTNAKVYGNFNINMKLMIYNVLCENVPNFLSLYNKRAVSTIVDNLSTGEIEKMIEKFDKNKEIGAFSFADINPAIFNYVSEFDKMSQMLHLIFKHYFTSSEKYYMVMNKVALRLSYSNKKIRAIIDDVYFQSISYDETIRQMQYTFKDIFATDEFATIIVEEINMAMTDLINKMFVTI